MLPFIFHAGVEEDESPPDEASAQHGIHGEKWAGFSFLAMRSTPLLRAMPSTIMQKNFCILYDPAKLRAFTSFLRSANQDLHHFLSLKQILAVRYPGSTLMALAATHSQLHPSYLGSASVYQMLEITIPLADLCEVRRVLTDMAGVAIMRCEPLLHPRAAYGSAIPRVRLTVKMPFSSYANVLHRIIENVPDGEIGQLAGWRSHLGKNSDAPVRAPNEPCKHHGSEEIDQERKGC